MTPIVPLSSAPSCAALSIPRGKAGDHDHALLAEIVGQLPRKPARRRRRVTRADHRHEKPIEKLQVALHSQQRRRIVEFSQSSRVQSLADGQIAPAERIDPRHLPLRVAYAREPRRLAPASGTASSAATAEPNRAMSWR